MSPRHPPLTKRTTGRGGDPLRPREPLSRTGEGFGGPGRTWAALVQRPGRDSLHKDRSPLSGRGSHSPCPRTPRSPVPVRVAGGCEDPVDGRPTGDTGREGTRLHGRARAPFLSLLPAERDDTPGAPGPAPDTGGRGPTGRGSESLTRGSLDKPSTRVGAVVGLGQGRVRGWTCLAAGGPE